MSDYTVLDLKHRRSATRKSTVLGTAGESIAAQFLIHNGYRLVIANFKTPIGRNRVGTSVSGEIDLIALDGETLCFIEVKTRRSEKFTPALSALDLRKQRQITRTSRMYRKIFEIKDVSIRFDAVSVIIEPGSEPVCELFKGFWTEGKFRKKSWSEYSYI